MNKPQAGGLMNCKAVTNGEHLCKRKAKYFIKDVACSGGHKPFAVCKRCNDLFFRATKKSIKDFAHYKIVKYLKSKKLEGRYINGKSKS